MKTKTANKYFNSRINGVLIRCMDVNEKTGKVKIIDENGDKHEHWVDVETASCTADYILCALQDESEIEVNKR